MKIQPTLVALLLSLSLTGMAQSPFGAPQDQVAGEALGAVQSGVAGLIEEGGMLLAFLSLFLLGLALNFDTLCLSDDPGHDRLFQPAE